MKHAKPHADPNVVDATAGHDFFYIHPGDFLTINGFTHDQDFVVFDSGTGYYDGLLGFAADFQDGTVFSNSAGTASFALHSVDANHDGVLDTQIDMIVGGQIIGGATVLSVDPGSLQADIFGG